jgi:uncharacterized protein YukE
MSQYEDGSGTAPSTGGGSGAAGGSDVPLIYKPGEKTGLDFGGTTAPTDFFNFGGANDVELTYGDVEKIGQETAALADEAEAAKTLLGDARGHAAAFGSYPPAQALQSHHQAVVNVFEATLGAITTSLDDFGNTIVQAAHAYEQTDEDVRASLVAIGTQVDTSSVRDEYNNARRDQNDPDRNHPDKLDDVTIEDPDGLAAEHPDLDQDAVDALKDSRGDDAHAGSGGGAFDGSASE